jgi:serine/threonine-protein kinase
MPTTTLVSRFSNSTDTKFAQAGSGSSAFGSGTFRRANRLERAVRVSTDLSLEPGAQIAGKYTVERVIGQGGAGVVVAAQHVLLRTRVAVKLLRHELEGNEEATHRFLREAQAVAQLRSQHVARVMDVGILDSGAPFIAMEYLDGRDLEALVQSAGPLRIADAVEYVLQACDALGEAHGLGIIHRDVKPANLFLTRTRDGRPLVKVLDFGVSKMAPAPGASSLTGARQVIGSPAFMSPEQIRAPRLVDARTDVWALGAVLYTLLAGEAPFTRRNWMDTLNAVLTDPIPSVHARRPEVPDALVDVIEGALRRDATYRIGSAGELSRALAPFASSATSRRHAA